MNAITYKEIFPKIKDNKMWLGVTRNGVGSMWFKIPETMPKKTGQKYDSDGNRYQTIGSSAWFTNLDHGKRHQRLELMTMDQNKKFNNKVAKSTIAYEKYDNYDAIEVSFVDIIPNDFPGVMGVPITFLGKYNPDQFEIVGCSYDYGRPEGWDPSINMAVSVGGVDIYKRLLIKHKKGQAQ